MSKSDRNTKMVQLRRETYDKLTLLGAKQDTYDSIISRLLEQQNQKSFNEVLKSV